MDLLMMNKPLLVMLPVSDPVPPPLPICSVAPLLIGVDVMLGWLSPVRISVPALIWSCPI